MIAGRIRIRPGHAGVARGGPVLCGLACAALTTGDGHCGPLLTATVMVGVPAVGAVLGDVGALAASAALAGYCGVVDLLVLLVGPSSDARLVLAGLAVAGSVSTGASLVRAALGGGLERAPSLVRHGDHPSPPVRVVWRPSDIDEVWWWCGAWSFFLAMSALATVVGVSYLVGPFVVVLIPPAVFITLGGVVGVVDLGARWSSGDPGAPAILAAVWAAFALLPAGGAVLLGLAGHVLIATAMVGLAIGHWILAGWARACAWRLDQKRGEL